MNTSAAVVKSTLRPHGDAHMPRRQARFDRLVASRRDDLFRYARWLTGNRDTADDLVQETLLRAWQSLDSLKRQQAARSWLLTILRHENARRYTRIKSRTSWLPVEEIASSQVDYDTSTEAYVLRRALEALPDRFRRPLLMQIVDGYTLKEIAHELDISVSGVGTRLFRAREKLRETVGCPD